MWSGEFTPPADGSLDGVIPLEISGMDSAPHFAGGPNAEGDYVARIFSGDALDGDPSSLASAIGLEPYFWVSYESGTDTNHFIMIDPC